METPENKSKKSAAAEREEAVLNFWKESDVFAKSLEKDSPKGEFVFYEGPPTANGKPGIHHLEGRAFKDAIPRYKTMQGFHVRRKGGWDTHGLPVELQVEKALGLNSKKAIEEYGIAKFNEHCKESVWEFTAQWEKFTDRIGYWVDQENPYVTYHNNYIESVWNVLQKVNDKGLLYKDYRIVPWCPRCGTALSSHELAQGYQDDKDLSVTAKFKVVGQENTYLLAWTTTPWTLPGNVALAVGADIEYSKISVASKSKKVFLISGKHALASKEYYPELSKNLTSKGYSVTIIDHENSSSPILEKNLTLLKKYDFSDAHVVVHSLGASTFLKFLNDSDQHIQSLTMFAPSYPGEVAVTRDQEWLKHSGYEGYSVDFAKIKNQIETQVTIVYSDDEIVRQESIAKLAKDLDANLVYEEGKKHFFGLEYMHLPDFEISFSEKYILATSRIEVNFKDVPFEVLGTMKGSEVVGLEYEPLYPYLSNTISDLQKQNLEKAFKVYPADFVTTEDGTGIVHTAVMYGADDFVLGTALGLPKQHMVLADGTFVEGTDFLAGRFVKDEAVAVDIIKDLAHRGLLFKKEKYEHSYPHCWRCKTPLIYYARDSWYIRMSDPVIKAEMIEENKKINWEPDYIQAGRFGEWLKDIKDWAISRERYWGTPLPIWTTADGKIEVIGSLAELKERTQTSGNTYFAMRHGYGQHMTAGVVSSFDHDSYHLTEEGKAEVAKSADMLKEKKITRIFTSPLLRTRETAKIVAQHLGIPEDTIVVDHRLREYDFGDWDGKPWEEYIAFREKTVVGYDTVLGGSSLLETKKRFGEFMYDVEADYANENILIVTHGIFFETVPAVLEGADDKRSTELLFDTFKNHRIQPAEVREMPFVPLPHNENYELDLHRPYIDSVKLVSKDGEELSRVKEVMDVWFDSGAMPFAQDHYPFENAEWVDTKGYPADYICEAIDQTRGWFYTLHAVGTLMGRGRAYKNVICLGHILDAEGKKMSKSLGNIVDPWTMIEKYGVDTLRLWMYSVNQPGESKNFDEKTVAELHNKVFNLLYNVLAFYELYRDETAEGDARPASKNVLDVWIMAKLDALIALTTENVDAYKLLEPVRAMREFIDGLSTWYVRRSRERIKDGDADAKATLYYVLKTVAQLLAPFAPFSAEDIWQKLKHAGDAASVHLSAWPEAQAYDAATLENMETLRNVVTMGLKARQTTRLPVRQPLARITVTGARMDDAYTEILKDELNVRATDFADGEEVAVALDTDITPELKREGEYRELVRTVQDMRKSEGLTPSDPIALTLPESARETASGFEDDLKKTVLAVSVDYAGDAIVIAKK